MSIAKYVPEGAGMMRVEQARAMLAECRGADEVKEIRDRALAIQAYARQKEAGQGAADDAGAIVVHASAKLAQFYRDAPSRQKDGLKKGKARAATLPNGISRESVAKDAGVPERELRRWVPLAESADAEEIEEVIERARNAGKGVTTSTVLRVIAAAAKPPVVVEDSQDPPEPKWLSTEAERTAALLRVEIAIGEVTSRWPRGVPVDPIRAVLQSTLSYLDRRAARRTR